MVPINQSLPKPVLAALIKHYSAQEYRLFYCQAFPLPGKIARANGYRAVCPEDYKRDLDV